jgi:hypothetical protein
VGSALIHDPAAARRLADQLVSDLRLYHGASSVLPQPAIVEARTLYRSRVEPPLYPLFEEALEAPASAHAKGASPIVILAVAIAAVGAALAAWLSSR